MDTFKQEIEKQASKESEKELEKVQAILDKYGLDLSNYSTADIDKKNAENIKKIASDLLGNKFFKAGMALSFAKAEEQAKVTYLSALVEQNWIIIRQNEAQLNLLKKLADNKS